MKKKSYIILGSICILLLFVLCFQIIFVNSIKNKEAKDNNETVNIQNEIEEKEQEVTKLEENYNTLKAENSDKEKLLEGFKKWKQEIDEMM